MTCTEREAQILERITAQRECSVGELASACKVSEMTIRRDLDELARQGRIVRTHGGATLSGGVVFEFRFLDRANHNRPAKERIARAAAAQVKDGEAVMLDSGTTTLAVARELRSRLDLTVITTSLPIASELQRCERIRVILLGGVMRRESPDLMGAIALQSLAALSGDVAFIGADAVDLEGNVYNESEDVAYLLNRLAGRAQRVYVVADSSKIGQRALARFGHLKDWCGLIVDAGISRKARESLRKNGVKVTVC